MNVKLCLKLFFYVSQNPIVCEACQAVASVLDKVLEENSTKVNNLVVG